MTAWNGWYHVIGNTYGTWLPGDPRGWREEHHKRHVEGDYRSPPPPGTGDRLHEHAERLLKRSPSHLDPPHREMAGRALVDMLLDQQVELLELSLDTVHFHLLGRFRDGQVLPPVGRAKRHAHFHLRAHGHKGRLWGTAATSSRSPAADTN